MSPPRQLPSRRRPQPKRAVYAAPQPPRAQGTSAEGIQVAGARYSYDTYANVTYQAFTWPNMSDTNSVFAYDDQNRVTAAYGQGFGWQPWGSLASLGGDTYGYAAGHPHAKVDVIDSDITFLDPSVSVRAIRFVSPNNDVATMDWLALPTEWQPGETSRKIYTKQNQLYLASVLPWPGTVDKMELTYIAPYLLSGSATSTPSQPTVVP